jgi:hypothetical protein
MRTVHDIKAAIRSLSGEDLAALRAWFAESDAEVWDRQFEQEVAEGRLDSLADEALQVRQQKIAAWEDRKTVETRKIEELFRAVFPKTDAYRYNSASIRVRIIDDRFEGRAIAEREAMVWPLLRKLPRKTRDDILLLLTLAPSERTTFNSQTMMNRVFEQPLPSRS